MKTNFLYFKILILVVFSVGFSGCSKEKKAPTVRSVAVSKGLAVLKDMPINIKTIAKVEPFSTVTVKTRISGELTGVFFKEGAEVKRGQLLFSIDSRSYENELAQAEAKLLKDMALLNHSELELKRYEPLYKEGFATKQQYERVLTDLSALKSAIKADKAEIENVKLKINYCSIKSPINGKTGNLIVNRGNLVKADDTILTTINQHIPVYVTVSVPEKYLPDIKEQMKKSKLVLNVFPDNNLQKPISGNITFIDNSVDNQTGTIKLKATFNNTDKTLTPGQFVDSMLTMKVIKNAVVVPSSAVLIGQEGSYVFVIKKDNTAEYRIVKSGISIDGFTVVEENLKQGEEVVTDGQMRLTNGVKVEIKNKEKDEKNKLNK